MKIAVLLRMASNDDLEFSFEANSFLDSLETFNAVTVCFFISNEMKSSSHSTKFHFQPNIQYRDLFNILAFHHIWLLLWTNYFFVHIYIAASGKSFVVGFSTWAPWDGSICPCLCCHKWCISTIIDRKSEHWSRDINKKSKLWSREGNTKSKLPSCGRLF